MLCLCKHEFLEILSENPMGTDEIATKLTCHYMTALRKLHRLHEQGIIEGKQINNVKNGQWIWWIKKETANDPKPAIN